MPANWPWTKHCKGLRNKPEVFCIAEILNMDRDHVVGKLHRLWEWCDDNISEVNVDENGHATVTIGAQQVRNIDSLVDVSGFADAMSAAGWLKVRSGSLTFPNYARHNGQPAKERALAAIRQRVSRAKKQANSESKKRHAKSVTREEKRREEYKPPPPSPNNTLICEPDSNAEEEEVLLRLRQMGVNEAVAALQEARSRGVTIVEVKAVVAHAESKPGAWGPGAIYHRIKTAVPGLSADAGWQKPAKAYLERQALAKQQSEAAARSSELRLVREEHDEPLSVFSGQDRDRVESMSEEEIKRLLVDSGNRFLVSSFCKHGLTHTVCMAISEALRKQIINGSTQGPVGTEADEIHDQEPRRLVRGS